MQLGPGTESKAKYGNDHRSTLGDTAAVSCEGLEAIIDLRDLDELTTVEEVTAAVNATMEGNVEEIRNFAVSGGSQSCSRLRGE